MDTFPVWAYLLASGLGATAGGLISWPVSVWIAKKQATAVLEAAETTASATRDAGVRHAIETEAVRLRYDISVRHMNTFYSLAEPLRADLVELPHNFQVADRFEKHVYPQTPLNVVLYAELSTLPDLYDRVQPIERTFTEAIYALARKLQAAGPDPDARSEADSREVTDYSIASVTSLLYLMRMVDLSNEIRVSSSDATSDMRRFEDALRRWERAKKVLRSPPPGLLPPSSPEGRSP